MESWVGTNNLVFCNYNMICLRKGTTQQLYMYELYSSRSLYYVMTGVLVSFVVERGFDSQLGSHQRP
jgi:hypothetical protein